MSITRRSLAFFLGVLFLSIDPAAHAGILRSHRVLLLCHRTANRDLPENTLPSLALAARMGCDVVEIDVRRTADDVLVLNHDGFLDRFTDTTGEVEETDVRELDQMDFGAWMGERFTGIHIAHFDDALRLAHELGVGLYPDIKTKGIGKQVLEAVAKAGMANQVMFGGEWDDIHRLDPRVNQDPTAGVQPGFTREDVQSLHEQHKVVIANFILNGHEFDLQGMKQAVRFGVDAIMVDYPRLGAEAVGRPVEAKIAELAHSADSGPINHRVQAIRELSQFIGFPLQPLFFRWLVTGDQKMSHEAALALVTSRPQPPLSSLEVATHSSSAAARSNAAWAIGVLSRRAADNSRCATLLVPLLHDESTEVLKQALVGLSRCPSDPQDVLPVVLERLMAGNIPVLRGLAAVALARHHPDIAEHAVPAQLEMEERRSDTSNAEWTAHGRPKLSPGEIARAVELYRAEMKELEAVELLPNQAALPALAAQAFRPGHDYSMAPILVAGYQLWDRIADDPAPALEALSSHDTAEADWAEWALIEGGPKILPTIRQALPSSDGELRRRLIEILGWEADTEAVNLLQPMEETDQSDRELIRWAVTSIQNLCPPQNRTRPAVTAP